MSVPTAQLRLLVDPARVPRWLVAVVLVELALLAVHFGLTSAEPTTLRYALYPFVWINLGLWAVSRTDPPASGGRTRLLAALVAATYFLALALAAGLVGFGHGHGGGLQLTMASPGWGPRIAYVSSAFHAQFIPFRVLGYLSLAYLVYATVLDAAAAALAGLAGFGTCLGCTFPLVAPVLVGTVGGTAVVPFLAVHSVDVSTAVFVVAVLLLAWGPGSRSG